MPNSPVHFEIPADDLARAKTFYEKTFGWKIKPFPMPPGEQYLSVITRKAGEPGIDGGMMPRKMPGQPFTNYISVKSIDAMLQSVQANGGQIALAKQEIGQGMGWIGCFLDTENNLIGLHQMPPPPPKTRAVAKSAPKAVARNTVRKTARKTAPVKKKPVMKKKAAKRRR